MRSRFQEAMRVRPALGDFDRMDRISWDEQDSEEVKRACGRASFLVGFGVVSEVRKFEMLKVARTIARVPKWLIAIYVACGLGLVKGALEDGKQWDLILVMALVCLFQIHRWWAMRRPAKFLEMTEEKVRGPLGWNKWVEIPRDRVEEVVATTEGLIIAWNKDGVTWYTEVMEMWFSEEEWVKVRAALMAWGNRGDVATALSADGRSKCL